MTRILLYTLLIISSCLICIENADGQVATSDSLELLLEQAGNDEESNILLYELVLYYRFTDPPRAIDYALKAKAVSNALNDFEQTFRIYTTMGHVFFDMGIYDKALDSYSNALNICNKRNNRPFAGFCLNNIGKVYLEQRIYSLAFKNFELAARVFEKEGMVSGLAQTYNNLGLSYCRIFDYDQAMQYFNEVLDLPGDSIDSRIRATTFTNIGHVFACQGDLPLASEFYIRALNIYSGLEDDRKIAGLHADLGDIEVQREDYAAAEEEYKLAIEIFGGLNNRKGLAEVYLSQLEISIETGRNDEAKLFANQAIAIAREYNFLEILKESYLLLSELHANMNEIHAAYDYYMYYNRIKDSIFNQNVSNAIARTETINTLWTYEINLDQIEKDRQDVIYTWYFVIAIFILSLLTIALAISRIFSQRKANKILSHQRNILKKTLIELRISEQKYKALFSQANDAIFLMDHKIFIDCNDKTPEMFGCIREDIIGHPPYEFSPPTQPDGMNSKEKALQLINQCIAGNPQRFYWLHSEKDGTLFDAEVSLNRVNLEGSIYIQAIVRNISKRVHAEKEMVQAREKAEKATESKTFFLAKMSHEIRTMLGGITSSSQLMMDTRVNKYQSELLDIINTSADNLLEIVNEILDFSKIEAGKIEIEDRAFNIRKMLEDNVNTYLPKSQGKGITTYLSIHHKIPDLISGDELRLKQILSNLLSNAIKFTDKGNVTIDVAVEKDTGNQLMIKFVVSDTGIGIPSGKLKDMFTEYSQSDVSISRRFGGTGLGLNIVYKLVNLMKGSVEVQSELNKGTQFTLIIPFRKAKDISSGHDDKPAPKLLSRHKYKILLAEDNVMNQKITMINLKNLGHHVDLAENGIEAWEKYQENDYDVILMDIQMPEMDGIEVTHLIRKHERENKSVKKIRIVALTANILGQDAEYCLSEGMDAYIAKPFRIEDLIEKLES